MGGEADNHAANGAAAEGEVKKKDSHSDHRDEFVMSKGLTTQGEASFVRRRDYLAPSGKRGEGVTARHKHVPHALQQGGGGLQPGPPTKSEP